MCKLFKHFLAMAMIMLLVSCGPRITYYPESTFEIRDNATFNVLKVNNRSKYVYHPEDKSTFDIEARMAQAMNDALSKKNVLSENPDYQLVINITRYELGNPSLEILTGGHMPELWAQVNIYNEKNMLIGTIQSTNNRGRGGIGGWNRIFDLVAEAFVENLIDSSTRKSNITLGR
ncbi:MAG: hypothetical protein FWG62_01625 [Proteobacteria bacterium]|nr:hypothetical protein [Pseudomonadota bacterium]